MSTICNKWQYISAHRGEINYIFLQLDNSRSLCNVVSVTNRQGMRQNLARVRTLRHNRCSDRAVWDGHTQTRPPSATLPSSSLRCSSSVNAGIPYMRCAIFREPQYGQTTSASSVFSTSLSFFIFAPLPLFTIHFCIVVVTRALHTHSYAARTVFGCSDGAPTSPSASRIRAYRDIAKR